MCDMCGMQYCPPACPSYEGELGGYGAVIGHCSLCEGAVHSGERVLYKGGDMLCESCVRDMEMDDLLAIEGVGDTLELLGERLDWRVRVC